MYCEAHHDAPYNPRDPVVRRRWDHLFVLCSLSDPPLIGSRRLPDIYPHCLCLSVGRLLESAHPAAFLQLVNWDRNIC